MKNESKRALALPAFISHIAAKAQRFADEHPDASETDVATAIVDDVDRLSIEVFELAA
jgi:hypothetical protein